MEFYIGSQALKVPRNCKAQEIFFLVFLVEFQLYFTRFLKVYVTFLLSRIYLTLKNEKKVPYVFSLQFMNPLILERKLSQPEMCLSRKYI